MIKGGVSVDVRHADIVLKGYAERSADLANVFRGPVDKLVTSLFVRQFATEGRYGGAPWARLKPATLRQKARLNRANMGVLRRFNTMWSAFTKAAGPYSLKRIDRLTYERGVRDMPRAYAHQHGRGKGLAKREIVPDPLPSVFVGTVERVVAKYVDGAA